MITEIIAELLQNEDGIVITLAKNGKVCRRGPAGRGSLARRGGSGDYLHR